MKHFFRYIPIILLVLAPSVSVFQISAQKRTGNNGKEQMQTISCNVTDSRGQAIAGAVVSAMEGRFSVLTDADGRFSIQSGVSEYLLVEAVGFENTTVYVPDVLSGGTIVMHESDASYSSIMMPFGSSTLRRTTGAVTNLKTGDYTDKVTDRTYVDMLEAFGYGVFNAGSVRGDNYTIVVDGLVRNGDISTYKFTDMMNLDEVEEITVLRDAASRVLYGTLADKPILMIKTRHGEKLKRTINISFEESAGVPVSFPKYMNASDYMELYNEARRNDGLIDKYSAQQIEDTKLGFDKVANPDHEYYTSEFLKACKPQRRIGADFSGGNNVAQYYLHLGYYNTQSILALGSAADQSTNRFNVRGNVDIGLNSFMKAHLSAATIFNSYHGANYAGGNFWSISTSERVNAYPLLIPISQINGACSSIVESARAQRSVINNKYLLGGSKVYTQNIYGDLLLGGYTNTTDRMSQVNMGLDVDLSALTEGLAFQSYVGTDNYNRYTISQNNSYAVYEPTFLDDGTYSIEQIGVNDFVGSQSISDVAFYRRWGWLNVLDYNRSFGEHSVECKAMSAMHTYKASGDLYTSRMLNFGGHFNYMYSNRYVLEWNGALIGSARFAYKNRWGYSNSLGAGWILSEEDFLKANDAVDYLKIRLSASTTSTDIDSLIDGFYLTQNTFTVGSAYSYGDGAGSNSAMTIARGNADFGWVKRNELDLGVDGWLFGRTINFAVDIFSSLRYDEPAKLSNTYPTHLGGNAFIPYQNYGKTRYRGIEVGVGYHDTFGDFRFGVDMNAACYIPRSVLVNEVDYGEGMEYRQQQGKSPYAIWGLVAEGLYTQDEIDIMGNAANTDIARPTFGNVQAGDIKYRDMNNDFKIDEDDLAVIGNSQARFHYGLTLTAGYRDWNLSVYLSAQSGGNKLYRGSYYNVYGEMKYPEHLKGRWAYSPEEGIDNRETATYPRLTTEENLNNFRNSSYWLASTDYLSIPMVQLSYNLRAEWLKTVAIKDVLLYVRATNLLTVGPDVDKMLLNVGSEPQMRWYYAGLKFNF